MRRPALSLLSALALSLTAALSAQEEPRASSPPAPAPVPESWLQDLGWRSIGPANMGGRITDLAVFPGDSCLWYVATASGGLLKTTNNGVDFEYLFQHEAVSSIGDVAVSASDPDIVWVGTGEENPRNSVSWGNGVYKSIDGGRTWEHMGLEETFQIGAIVIHPTNPDIVYVGALGRLWGPNEQRGLFKTTDGGKTWEKVLYVDENTGVLEVEMHPADPDILLATTYERRRDLYDSNDPAVKWGEGSGLWRSIDGGRTWVRITEGLPRVRMGRIGIDWYQADPSVVYAIVESEKITQIPEDAGWLGANSEDAEVGARLTSVEKDGPAAQAGLQEGDIVVQIGGELLLSRSDLRKFLHTRKAGETVPVVVSRERELVQAEVTLGHRPENQEDATDELGRPRPGPYHGGLGGQRENIQDEQGPDGRDFGGVYRSEDGGVTWTRVNSLNPRPMYFSEIRVDPQDDNYVYVCGVQLYRSQDGGHTFSPDGHGREVHVDHHALWIDPSDGRHMILGNDGGIYVTWDRMEHWDHLNHVAIGQFYEVEVDSTRDYWVYGGLQDNGTWGGPHRGRHGEGPVNTDWTRISGGDGFVVRVDPENPQLVYSESQNGGMVRRHFGTGERSSIRPKAPRGTRYRFNWDTPFLLSHHNPKIFYTAGNFVFRSLSKGENLKAISPEIPRTDRGSATALAESPLDPEFLLAGTDDGALWMTEDGGNTWVDLWNPEEPTPEESQPERPGDIATSPGGPRTQEPGSGGVAEEAAEAAGGTVAEDRQDPVSGVWKGFIESEHFEDTEGFEFSLKLSEDGSLSGDYSSRMGEGELDGRYDAENGEATFRFQSDEFEIEFRARVTEGSMQGSLEAAGGGFRADFRAERTGPLEAQEPVDAEEIPGDLLRDLLPQPMYVRSIVPSRFNRDRVYLGIDGHRSDDTRPWLFISEDRGRHWRSIRGNLPDEAGSVRILEEDLFRENLLFLGTEHGAWVSVDRGQNWTRMNGSRLPTVPVHDFALHPLSGEIVAGTHGRSLWITDVTVLRQLDAEALAERVRLYEPNDVVVWRQLPRRGNSGTRRFVGENPSGNAEIWYSLGREARDLELWITDLAGEILYRFEEPPREAGMHKLEWNLRRQPAGDGGRGRRRFARRVGPGTYVVHLRSGGETEQVRFEVQLDPTEPDPTWFAEEERQAEEEFLHGLLGTRGGEGKPVPRVWWSD